MAGKTSKRRKAKGPTVSIATKKVRSAKALNNGQVQSSELNGVLMEGIKSLQKVPLTKPAAKVLKQMEVVCEAQEIVINECQGAASVLNPMPGLTIALKSIEHEENRKKLAASGELQRHCCESGVVKEARKIVANNNAENLFP